MITSQFKTFFNGITEPIARLLVRFKVTPNMLTLAGLIFGTLVCLDFLRTQEVVRFSLLIVLFGLFDALDGAVARVTGKSTRFGAYLDAVCDRLFEGVVIVTVAFVTEEWLLLMLLLLGSLLVSYTKARAAMEVTVSNTEWPDLMERTERCLLFIFGLLLADLFPFKIGNHDLFHWTLVLLNLLVYLTIFQRIKRAHTLIRLRH